jgi:hypothetical protein
MDEGERTEVVLGTHESSKNKAILWASWWGCWFLCQAGSAKAPSCTDDYKSTRDPSSYYPILMATIVFHVVIIGTMKGSCQWALISFLRDFTWGTEGGKQMWWVLDGWMDGVCIGNTPFTLVWMLAMYEPSTCIYIPGSHQVPYLLPTCTVITYIPYLFRSDTFNGMVTPDVISNFRLMLIILKLVISTHLKC